MKFAASAYLIALLLCCGDIVSSALECFPMSSPASVRDTRQLPAPVQAIIPSLRFECDGLVTGGTIQAVGDLSVDLQIWRLQGNTETLYNLVWQREIRRRISTGGVSEVSFTMSPGVPVEVGDVVGFHTIVSSQVQFDTSQQRQVFLMDSTQGPLCNFSLNGPDVRSVMSPVPQLSFTFVNATDQEIAAAEQSLPNIADTCTVLPPSTSPPIVSTESPISSRPSRPSSSRPPSSSSQQPIEVTTQSSSSDLINNSGPTDEAPTEMFFLSLTQVEFILIVTILVVIFVSICVVITIALCCCMYVQRMNNCRGKEEAQMSMNANPVYDTIPTPTAQPPCSAVPLPCAGGQQPTLVALMPAPCNQTVLSNATTSLCQQNLGALSSSRQTLSSMDSINSTAGHQQTNSADSDTYSYPNLRLALQERNNNQRTSDGYIIVQPDHYVQNTPRENATDDTAEQLGPRGLLDHTL